MLLVVLPLQILFNLGLAAASARLAVPFRDINNLIPYLNRIWLYTSPIIWPLSMLTSMSETGPEPVPAQSDVPHHRPVQDRTARGPAGNG